MITRERPAALRPGAPGAPAPAAGPAADAAVWAGDLTKTYAGRRAVDGVDLVVPRGGVHGLLGPNGAGKTTLLRMLLGLVAPDAGDLRVLGGTPFGAGGALPGVAGFVDAPRFYPYLSAARNLDLLAALDGTPRSTARVDALLEQVGLGGRAGEKVRGFSTGMRQRLGLAAVLLRDPDLLVLDEPTSGLDPAGVAELHRVIREVAASGRTVLLSSHDMGEVEELCDAVTILREGRVVHAGSLRDLRAQADAPTYLLETADQARARLEVVRVGGAVLGGDPVDSYDDGDPFGPDGSYDPDDPYDPSDPYDLGEPGGWAVDGPILVSVTEPQLDDVVLALGRDGVPVRSLVRRDTALNAMFLRLTGDPV